MKRKTIASYAEQRFALLVELRILRITSPARRVVKHVQMQMRKLRTARRMGAV